MKQILAWMRLTVVMTGLSVALVGAMPSAVHAAPLEGNTPEEQQRRDIEALDCSPETTDYRETSDKCNLYKKYINPIILVLSSLVGLAVVIGIISGAIRYSASGGDPSQAAAAKKQIRNAIVALIAYLFLLAGMNWLVPGGLI